MSLKNLAAWNNGSKTVSSACGTKKNSSACGCGSKKNSSACGCGSK